MRFIEDVTAVLITRDPVWPADVPLDDIPFGEVKLQTSCPNVFQRFVLAAEAKCERIYVQDDDVVIDVRELFKHDIIASITNIMPPGFQQIYRGTDVTLIGFGAFFPRWMAEQFVERQQRWRDAFGDEVFEAEADRFFTWTHWPHNEVHLPMRQIRRPVRMSDRPNHYKTRDEIFRRLKEMREDQHHDRD